MEQALQQRQDGERVTDGRGNVWWFSPTAVIIKWAILGGIFLIFFLWIVGGYFHARQRIKKGLPPLRYHKFLVPQHLRPPKRTRYNPNEFTLHRVDPGYGPDQMPPPMYDPSQGPPPTYLPPDGASKVNPAQDQDYREVGMPPSPSQLESQARLPFRPTTARSPRAPWLKKILPRRNT